MTFLKKYWWHMLLLLLCVVFYFTGYEQALFRGMGNFIGIALLVWLVPTLFNWLKVK